MPNAAKSPFYLALAGCLLTLLCATALAAGPSAAELERAKAHFAQGKDFFDRGELPPARAEFEESYRLSGRADLLFNLAVVADKMGEHAAAAAYLEEYLRQRPSAKDAREIRRNIASLRAQQREQDRAAAAQGPPDPPPAIVAPPPAAVTLAPPVLVPVPPRPAPRRVLPWPALVLLGGGVALVGVGIGLGGAALANAGAVEKRFDPTLDQQGRQLDGAGIALDVLGGLCAAGGATWLIVSLAGKRQAERPGRAALAPRGLGLQLTGSF